VTLRLSPELDGDPIEWRAEMDFLSELHAPWQVVLGQVGFFDQFTVTFSRAALQLAVEPMEEFDRRWGPRLARAGT
jgi:hypothetical protein